LLPGPCCRWEGLLLRITVLQPCRAFTNLQKKHSFGTTTAFASATDTYGEALTYGVVVCTRIRQQYFGIWSAITDFNAKKCHEKH